MVLSYALSVAEEKPRQRAVGNSHGEFAEITGLEVRHIRYRWQKAPDWVKDQLAG